MSLRSYLNPCNNTCAKFNECEAKYKGQYVVCDERERVSVPERPYIDKWYWEE